jgi:hypothetical protein
LEIVRGLQVLGLTVEAESLMRALLATGALPPRAQTDAAHLAIATAAKTCPKAQALLAPRESRSEHRCFELTEIPCNGKSKATSSGGCRSGARFRFGNDPGSITMTMSALTQTLIDEIKSAPETVQHEVFDFLLFLKTREPSRSEGHENLLSLAQTAWGPDWATQEEDEAWRDL